jgi:hypothetical protein
MFTDEHFERASAEANRPTIRLARPRGPASLLPSRFQFLGDSHEGVEARIFLLLAESEWNLADSRSAAVAWCLSGGRNLPVHFLPRFSPRNLRAGQPILPGVPETLCVSGWLPDTVNRVETHLSHRKQTTAHASTRNVPAHDYFRVLFVRASAKMARRQRSGGPLSLQEESGFLVGHKAASVGMTIVNQRCGGRPGRIRDDTYAEPARLHCDRVEAQDATSPISKHTRT